MAIAYICCQCDADMTMAVQTACNAKPDLRPTLVFRGLEFQHSQASIVTLKCPNGHVCNYPCGED